jgi:hypothetical protein
MNKEDLNELLDTIYELEGLVHLAINRDDSPGHLRNLILKKANAVAEYTALVCEEETPAAPVAEAPAPAAEAPAPVIEAPVVEVPAPVIEAPAPVAEAPAVVEEEIAVERVEVEENEAPLYEMPEEEPEVNVEPSVDCEPEVAAAPAPVARKMQAEPRGRLVFSINDRYRFKRELFNNSDADFNTTLALVASMEGYDEAEGYFIDELGWNEQSAEVTDFLDILKKYFKE